MLSSFLRTGVSVCKVGFPAFSEIENTVTSLAMIGSRRKEWSFLVRDWGVFLFAVLDDTGEPRIWSKEHALGSQTSRRRVVVDDRMGTAGRQVKRRCGGHRLASGGHSLQYVYR